MRKLALAVAFSAFMVTPVLAGDAPDATKAATNAAQTQAAPARVVYVCDSSAMTRRGFAREYGSAEFVTAETAAYSSEVWAAPKCISPAEARRLKTLREKSKEMASAR